MTQTTKESHVATFSDLARTICDDGSLSNDIACLCQVVAEETVLECELHSPQGEVAIFDNIVARALARIRKKA